ncbi:AraC family transcriptional regulator [Flavobacterium lindanitolerans]|nr:AraC family transcriptional regulator [Flavobacterium lindanitolerans]
MTDEKIFLDNELSLPILADKLKISIHDTSYLINEVTGNNFYNYINSKRVEEAKRLLLSDKSEGLNMLGIAFASGFNSKTTFNTAFKKWAGLSPSQYQKQNIKK